MVHIEQMTTEYVQQLGLLNKLLIDDDRHANPMSVPDLVRRMKRWLSEDYLCFGAFVDQDLVGYCLIRDEDEYCYVRQLFTVKHHRNQGIGSRLLKHLESGNRQSKPVRLEVLAGNERAVSFYKRRGYHLYCYTMVKDPQ